MVIADHDDRPDAPIYRGKPVGHAGLTQATMDDDVAQVWHEHTGEHRAAGDTVRLFVDSEYRWHWWADCSCIRLESMGASTVWRWRPMSC